jgi:hypothetical protein
MIFIFILLFDFSCKDKHTIRHDDLTDLLQYGIPYAIKAPADVVINRIGQGELTDVSIKNDSGFDLQVFMSKARTSDVKKIINEKKNLVVTNPFFVKIIEEYDDGFMFENRSDEGKISVDFILVKIIGDNEITFQCGNSREFVESEVKEMVKAIKY